MSIPAIILAAGASRRLGQPKQLVGIAGETLLARTIRVVRESGADPILVVLGANWESIAAAVDLSQVQIVENPDWQQGISTSIRAGIESFEHLYPDADAALFLVCDQPRLTAEHLSGLIEAYVEADRPVIVASEYAGSAGIPAIFSSSHFARLLALEGDQGAKVLLRTPESPVIAKHFEGGEIDIDTPSDLISNQDG